MYIYKYVYISVAFASRLSTTTNIILHDDYLMLPSWQSI